MEKKFSNMIQSSAKGSLTLILGQMGSTLLSAIGTILVARMLGSTSFGVLSVAQVPISVALLLINNSVSSAIIKFIAESRHEDNLDEIKNIIFAGFTFNILIGLVTTCGLYLISGYLANQVFQRGEIEQLIKILSISLLATSILNTSYAVLVGFERMGQRSVISITFSLLKSSIGPLLVFFGFGIIGVAFSTSIPSFIAGILGLFTVYLNTKHLPSSSNSGYKRNLSKIFFYSYPLFFSNILSGSMNQFFNIVLPLYVTDHIMGNYSAASSFSVLVLFFMTPVTTATFPLLSKLKPSDSVFEFVFQNIVKYESLIIFPIASVIIALSDQLVLVLYGESYNYSPLFLRILMLNFFFIGLGSHVANSLLNSQKETKVTFTSTLLYMIPGIPIGLFLIPKLGVIGYQATIILAPKIGLLYTLWWIKRNYNISIDYAGFVKIFISAIVALIGCVILENSILLNPWIELILCGLFYFVCYFMMILFTGALTRQNLIDIHNILAKYPAAIRYLDPVFSLLYKLSRNKKGY